ncbi:MAG: hypothetical protein WBG11_04575 [Methylocella sp.]
MSAVLSCQGTRKIRKVLSDSSSMGSNLYPGDEPMTANAQSNRKTKAGF